RILYGVLLVFVLIPGVLFAIDRGLPIPWTDFDETIRESIQRITWMPSAHKPVRFSSLKETYYAGVTYVIPAAKYTAFGDLKVKKGATVRIEAGADFMMGPQAGFLVEGILEAGESGENKQVSFRSLDSSSNWKNLTFWGRG